MAQSDRDVLFANEAFLIGLLQAVSGASLVAGLSQAATLVEFPGKVPFLLFLTLMVIALLSSVLAAFWKHEYKMWDVKGQASVAKGNREDAQSRSQRASAEVWEMRWAMRAALVGILLGFIVLITAIWVRAL